MNKFWNVIAGMTGLILALYAGTFAAAVFTGGATVEEFRQGVLPVLTAVLGYMAGMLPKADV